MIISTPSDIAATWLSKFDSAVSSGNVQTTVSMFVLEGWLRDGLVFTWDARSLCGRDGITAYLSDTLRAARIANFKLDDRPRLQPARTSASNFSVEGVSAGFTFDTPIAYGQGDAQLVFDELSGEWKAISVYMTLTDLKGHEEVGREAGVYGGHTLSWEAVNNERRATIESDPHVIIVGAGQTGLNVAARFKQMKIPSIVVEEQARVGDNWRKRYPTLSLHTPRNHHSMLYQQYPSNWPDYTPRDKLADWLEQYVSSQDLVVWTGSRLLPGATYDPSTKRWTVVVSKNGTPVELHPAHIVIAIGSLGAPRIPNVLDAHLFQGTTFHASKYAGGHPFKNKRCIVIGAGNTSADVCQDLAYHSASSVTMVQRSSSCVIAQSTTASALRFLFPEHVPQDINVFKYVSIPLGLMRKWSSAKEGDLWANEREVHEKLRKGGVELNMGRDGSGQPVLVAERLGGYWLDVGCADLIASGRVKVKQGVQVARFTPTSVIFTDGSELEADVVIFATGYGDPREILKPIFGAEIIDRTKEVWGIDDEGEMKACYRPTGQAGLWYAGGDFANSCFYSKQLALQIKAIELGLVPA